MSTEEPKRSITGGLIGKPISDDRKVSPVAALATKRIIIKNADMKDDMQKEAVDIAIAAFEKDNVEKDVAEHIKKEFDRRHGPTWHCIVGRNFGITDWGMVWKRHLSSHAAVSVSVSAMLYSSNLPQALPLVCNIELAISESVPS